ncbi:MAG: phage-like protein [Candidatus Gottesmanbacteria bacterium GW2011_GWA2_43_14]|uniref:Phage-like protein n=1 Tax=Candidatus Gottesmanbacteria bacterium GW2011_GWA2_43_14 TaxID=1618443 RepID=A0A0G1GFZ9_9BACT|nr:MAG: phage-like protein [Candidatus Gottesmanbacteria bacterium GW2011_GWA2_43_14]
MDSIDWKIITYESDRGEKPIDEFLKKQQAFTRAKIIHNIGLLRTYGNLLTMPHVKMLGSGLFELRIRGKEELRIFYCFSGSKTIYLLHAFKKKTQKTPQKEHDLALERKKQLTTI